MNIANSTETGKKRVKLSKDELKKLRSFKRDFATSTQCADVIGIKRLTLDRVMQIGSGYDTTIDKIRKVLTGIVEEKRDIKV